MCRQTCWEGMGVLRGSFKVKETLLREKLLLVELWVGTEGVQALAMEAIHSDTLTQPQSHTATRSW